MPVLGSLLLLADLQLGKDGVCSNRGCAENEASPFGREAGGSAACATAASWRSQSSTAPFSSTAIACSPCNRCGAAEACALFRASAFFWLVSFLELWVR